jgi:hypothetical protein
MRQNAEDGFLGEWHPSLLATKANAKDTPTWGDAMNGPYSQGFKKACQLEIDALMNMECWDVVDRPNYRSIVSSTWAFKNKRFPDGSMRKLKARFVPVVLSRWRASTSIKRLSQSSTGLLFVYSS